MPLQLGPDADEMYEPVRRAIEDAMWNVLGTVAYALFLGLLLVAGLALLVVTLLVGPTPLGGGLFAVAALFVGGSAYELDRAFDLRDRARSRDTGARDRERRRRRR